MSQSTIAQSLLAHGYWIGDEPWLAETAVTDAYDACHAQLARMLETDHAKLKDRGPGIYDMPWPRAMSGLKADLVSRLTAALPDYRLLSARVIVNMQQSTAQPVHRDLNVPNTQVIFMVPLVDVSQDLGPTKLYCRADAPPLLALTRAGVPYAFDAHVLHCASANTSPSTIRPVLVLDMCKLGACACLRRDKLYKLGRQPRKSF